MDQSPPFSNSVNFVFLKQNFRHELCISQIFAPALPLQICPPEEAVPSTRCSHKTPKTYAGLNSGKLQNMDILNCVYSLLTRGKGDPWRATITRYDHFNRVGRMNIRIHSA